MKLSTRWQAGYALCRQHPAGWPAPLRSGLRLLVFCLPLLSGWHAVLASARQALANAAQEQVRLTSSYQQRLQQVSTIPALQAQQHRLLQAIRAHQLNFSDGDDPGILLGEIAAIAAHHQLQLEHAQPAALMSSSHYRMQPLQLRLLGRYHDFGRFAASLAAAPRMLIFSKLQLTAIDETGEQLRLDATLLSYHRQLAQGRP